MARARKRVPPLTQPQVDDLADLIAIDGQGQGPSEICIPQEVAHFPLKVLVHEQGVFHASTGAGPLHYPELRLLLVLL